MTSASALEYRSRYELVEEARSLGVERPERMTVQELKDEILRLTLSGEEQQGARGLFGVARAMLASVVEAGLKMPDAARVIRGDSNLDLPVRSLSPVATVTLAEIYAAQGHRARALAVLEEVLASEPDHQEAQRILREMESGGFPAAEAPSTPSNPIAAPLRRPEAMASEPGYAGLADAGLTDAGRADRVHAAGAGDFPSTEYVPIEVVETTGHESAEETPLRPSEPEVDSERAPEPVRADAPPSTPTSETGSGPILALEQRGSSLRLYWELPPETVARSGFTEAEGGPAVVVVAFTPAGPAPLRDQRTLHLAWQPPFTGSLLVADLPVLASVRAAVGWMVDGAFLPLAVGRSLDRLASESPAAADRAASVLATL